LRHAGKIYDLVKKKRDAVTPNREQLNIDNMISHLKAITTAAQIK